MSERARFACAGLFAVALVTGCTRAPAPCGDDTDCANTQCVNGACVPFAPLDAGVVFDGGLDAGDPRDQGPDTDGGPMDAAPIIDAQPGCEHLMLEAQIISDATEVRRDEPVELRVTAANGATIEYASSAGGAFVDQPAGTVWIARDDVDWPWRTDRVTLTVTATLDDCRAQRRLQVTLLGDVLVADVLSGRLDVFGSNGTPFGQWRLIDQSGVSVLAAMPDGGFVVGIRGEENDPNRPPQIIRLNANGEEMLRFQTEDLDGLPIFTRVIEHLHVRDGQVIAANTTDDTIRWYDFDGRLVRSVPGGGNWIESMAPRGDTVIFSRDRESRVFELRGDERALVADASAAVYGLYPLPDGATLMVLESSETELEVLDAEGRVQPVPPLPLRYSVSGLTRFDDGYLALSQSTGRIIELKADLTVIEDFEFATYQSENPRAIIWLHTD